MTHTTKNYLLLCIVGLLLISMWGCASYPVAMQEKGMVAWNYKSPPVNEESKSVTIQKSLSIKDLEKKEPRFKINPNAGLSLFPILSIPNFFLTTQEFTNYNFYDQIGPFPERNTGLKKGEIEGILVNELQRNRIFKDVVYGDVKKDYALQGSVNFYLNIYRHISGLGTFFWGGLIIPALTLPFETDELICEAHFEIVTQDSKKTVFSKDYTSTISYNMGLFYNDSKYYEAFGDEAFPKIVQQFISDVKAIPASAWEK